MITTYYVHIGSDVETLVVMICLSPLPQALMNDASYHKTKG